jgi:hypothetical protein
MPRCSTTHGSRAAAKQPHSRAHTNTRQALPAARMLACLPADRPACRALTRGKPPSHAQTGAARGRASGRGAARRDAAPARPGAARFLPRGDRPSRQDRLEPSAAAWDPARAHRSRPPASNLARSLPGAPASGKGRSVERGGGRGRGRAGGRRARMIRRTAVGDARAGGRRVQAISGAAAAGAWARSRRSPGCRSLLDRFRLRQGQAGAATRPAQRAQCGGAAQSDELRPAPCRAPTGGGPHPLHPGAFRPAYPSRFGASFQGRAHGQAWPSPPPQPRTL